MFYIFLSFLHLTEKPESETECYFYVIIPLEVVHDQLTTSCKEHQVTREEAGGGSNLPAIQEVDHVTHRVSRSEESLKVQTAKSNGVPVGERAGDKRASL